MRIVKDPFTGELLLSLDTFESKQVRDKGFVKISNHSSFFGSLRLLYMFTRPYGEVHTLITGLAQLQETSNESGQKQETKKV
jgi:hypothetical protein